MAKKYISLGQLSIAPELLDFVNNELLPGTGIAQARRGSPSVPVRQTCFFSSTMLFRVDGQDNPGPGKNQPRAGIRLEAGSRGSFRTGFPPRGSGRDPPARPGSGRG